MNHFNRDTQLLRALSDADYFQANDLSGLSFEEYRDATFSLLVLERTDEELMLKAISDKTGEYVYDFLREAPTEIQVLFPEFYVDMDGQDDHLTLINALCNSQWYDNYLLKRFDFPEDAYLPTRSLSELLAVQYNMAQNLQELPMDEEHGLYHKTEADMIDIINEFSFGAPEFDMMEDEPLEIEQQLDLAAYDEDLFLEMWRADELPQPVKLAILIEMAKNPEINAYQAFKLTR